MSGRQYPRGGKRDRPVEPPKSSALLLLESLIQAGDGTFPVSCGRAQDGRRCLISWGEGARGKEAACFSLPSPLPTSFCASR